MPKISADYIFNSPVGFLQHHYLEVDEGGKILDIQPIKDDDVVRYYKGILVPGFVNAHCHLELSAMKRQIQEGLGMVSFIGEIFAKRHTFTDKEKIQAADREMKRMYAKGTVGLADICNTLVSLTVKCKNPEVFTYSFIELLGLNPARLELELQKGREYLTEFGVEGMKASITSHAPYSMSEELLKAIAVQRPDRMSVHLLESVAEREIFEEKTGEFVSFYKSLQLASQEFPSPSPVEYVLSGLEEEQPMILVHNTEMTPKEIAQVVETFPNASFCLCPRSNYYIHRTYPQVKNFMELTDQICLGTDSLASNHDLDVFEEAKCLHKISPEIPLIKLLDWLTYQGAKAIGQEARLGAFHQDTTPGINLIENLDLENLRLVKESRVNKLF